MRVIIDTSLQLELHLVINISFTTTLALPFMMILFFIQLLDDNLGEDPCNNKFGTLFLNVGEIFKALLSIDFSRK